MALHHLSQLLLLLLLPLLVQQHSVSAAQQQLTCQHLSLKSVCQHAPEGFSFSDGCNHIECDGSGSGSTTFTFCPEAETQQQRQRCVQLAQQVASRLPAAACPNLAAAVVCRGKQDGFRYHDGCNGVTCGPSGSTTLRQCATGDPEGFFCRIMRLKLQGGSDGIQEEEEEEKDLGMPVICPQLAARKVCKPSIAGFSYSDGCNRIRCGQQGAAASSSRMSCPHATSAHAGAAAYCARAVRRKQLKLRASRYHKKCIEAKDICRAGSRLRFNDGCNSCFCTGEGEAACTRMSCDEFFGTEAEFMDECKRRGAGAF